MKRIVLSVLFVSLSVPAIASTHKDVLNVSCNELWRAVKDTLRNSGKYGIIAIDDAEMTASYNMGGNLTAKRTNSAVLNSMKNGAACELQIQTAYSGLVNNDAGDMKTRVEESLVKLKNVPLRLPRALRLRPLYSQPLRRPRCRLIPPPQARTSRSTAHSSATHLPPSLSPQEAIRSPSRKRDSLTGTRPSTLPAAQFT